MSKVKILFLASGRRVSLFRFFKEALKELGLEGEIIAGDAGRTSPASYVADKYIKLPRVSSDNYIEYLVEFCKTNQITAVISLIDTDLAILAKNKGKFENINTKVITSSVELNEICFDKRKTYDFFTKNNIPTPKILNNLENLNFPVLLKPYDGSSGKNVFIIKSQWELDFFVKYVPNAMIQELVIGTEFTVDLYFDFNHQLRAIIPRERLEIRAGEVSKGVTRKDQSVIDACTFLASKLPQPIGCITAQCFKETNGNIKFIEINPRFGGGYPLSYHAGANFPKWIIEELINEKTSANDNWLNNIYMLRYDDEIIKAESELYE